MDKRIRAVNSWNYATHVIIGIDSEAETAINPTAFGVIANEYGVDLILSRLSDDHLGHAATKAEAKAGREAAVSFLRQWADALDF